MSIELFNQINIMATVQFFKWTPIFIVNFSTISPCNFWRNKRTRKPYAHPRKNLSDNQNWKFQVDWVNLLRDIFAQKCKQVVLRKSSLKLNESYKTL